MDRIVVSIHPFVRQQEINVFQSDECIETLNCTLEDMEDTIIKECKKYNIDTVDTYGGQLFVMKMKEHFDANSITEYDCSKIKLNIH